MITDFLTGLAILAALITGGEAPQQLGAFGDPFLSLQVGTNPTSGDCLQTNGTDSTWDPCPAGGGGGSFPFTATTNYGQVVYATGTPTLWFQNGFFASSTSYLVNLFSTNATSTNATTTNLHISSILNFGGDLIDELVGTGLQVSGGDLQTTLGTAITSSEITDNEIIEPDLSADDAPSDGDLLAYDSTGTNFVWETLTGGDAITLTAYDIDFDGGATPSGDLGGTWASPSVTDDSHNHTSTSISGLDISADTNLTGGLGLTLTGDDMACDTASGSVFGCLASADWTTFNSKLGGYDAWTHPQAGTSATTSGMIFSAASSTFTGGLSVLNGTTTNATSTTLNVSGQVDLDTLTSALVLAGSTGVLAEYAGASCTNQVVTALTAAGGATCTTINGNYLDLTANYAWTGAHDFGGGVIEITNGASPTVDAIGEIALDTTANELLIATSTTAAAPVVLKPYEWKGFAFGSTTQGSGSTTKPFFIAPPNSAGYFDSITCHATSTTATKAFMRVVLRDETNNRTNDLIASSTEGIVKLTSNQSFTGSEVFSAEIGTTTNIAADVFGTCWVTIFFTRN